VEIEQNNSQVVTGHCGPTN